MDTDALILVSVDDHLVEPPTLVRRRTSPAVDRDRAPKIVHTDIGDDVWMFEGEAVPYMGLNAVPGRPRARRYGIEPMVVRRDAPRVLGRARAGEGHERGWCAASLNFPSFPGSPAASSPRSTTRTSRSPSSGNRCN